MNYVRGPWRWVTEGSESFWAPPPGFAGVDLRPLAEQAVAGGTPGLGIFVGDSDPGKDYDVLGSGSWNDIKSNKKLRDSMPGKYRPKGDDLLGLILDIFTDGADPDGVDGPKPLMPGVSGRIELLCGGRSHFENFRWGDRFTAKIRDVIQRDFAQTMADAQAGKLKDAEHHRRVLDALCDKYAVTDWQEFVPAKLQKDVPGRLKHETTVTDNFNRADATGLGASWANMTGSGFDIASNQARGTNATSSGTRSRYESDLSSVDHYSQNEIVSYGTVTASNIGALGRCSSSADTSYAWVLRGNTPFRRLFKVVAGTATLLSSDTTAATTSTVKISCNGSAIKVYVAGSEIVGLAVTDTSITTGLRGGMQGQQDVTASVRTISDNFEAADLAASGLLYTQLERGTRGMLRGMYTKWG